MKRLFTLLIVGSLASPGLFTIGCDDTVHKSETVQRKSDGTVVTEKEKTTRSGDGSMETTKEKSVDRSETNRNP